MQLRIKTFQRFLRSLHAHPLMVPIVTFVSLLVLSTIGYMLLNHNDAPVPNAYVVIISHDHAEQTVPSREPTVGTLLKKLNISLNQGDVVEPSKSTPINQEDFRITSTALCR